MAQAVDWDAMYEDEEEDLGSLDGQGSVIKHLISQIRIGMDLTKVVLPTFILEKRSLLEMYADFFAHPDLFSAIPDFKTPEERMIQLVKWYISAFHVGRKSSVAKKPYNPILGEIFLCHWDLQGQLGQNEANNFINNNIINNDSLNTSNSASYNSSDNNSSQNTTNSNIESSPLSDIEKFSHNLPANNLLFIAEQVSHHPPVSAFYVENPSKKISCSAQIYTKSKFLGLSVGVHNIGQGVVELLEHKETYVCTFPSAYGRSILTVPWVELGGKISITCQETGYSANIEFLAKPFYGGKKHLITGEILRPNKEKILNIEGEWNDVIYSKDCVGNKEIYVDTKSLPVIKKQVRLIDCQEQYESRNVWKEVTRALRMKEVASATAAKSFIEQRQRDQLKERAEQKEKWTPRYFESIGDRWIYTKPLSKRLAKQ